MTIKFLTDEQYDALIIMLRGEQAIGNNAALLLELCATIGVRLEELCRIQVNNLQRDDKEFTVHIARPAKGGKQRTLPIEQHLFEQLQLAIGERLLNGHDLLVDIMPMEHGNNGEIVTSSGRKQKLRRLFKRTVAKQFSGIDVSTHSLRHTFAIRLYKRTKDIRIVQWALGHSSINSTLIYVAIVDYKALHPEVLAAMRSVA